MIKLNASVEKKIIKLYRKRKYTHQEIADQCSVSKPTINNVLHRNNINRRTLTGKYESIERGNEKRCCECGKFKNKNKNFSVNQKNKNTGKLYYTSRCTPCRSLININRKHNDFEYHMNDRVNSARRRATGKEKSKRYKKPLDPVPFNIDTLYMLELFDFQKGLCFYSDDPINLSPSRRGDDEGMKYSLSIDRIVPHLGYVKGNVVLCINRINTMKGNATLKELEKWHPKWYNRIMKFFAENKIGRIAA